MHYKIIGSATTTKNWDKNREPIKIGSNDRVTFSNWDCGGDLKVKVTDRIPGRSRRNLQVTPDCHFYGGAGIELVDVHLGIIDKPTFEDLRPLNDRYSTAIKIRSKNKSNGVKIYAPDITGYFRAIHIDGDGEGGKVDDATIIGGWQGVIRTYETLHPGTYVVDGHINVADIAVYQPYGGHWALRDTLIHRNTAQPVVYAVADHDNRLTPIVTPGVDRSDGESWPEVWRKEIVRRLNAIDDSADDPAHKARMKKKLAGTLDYNPKWAWV